MKKTDTRNAGSPVGTFTPPAIGGYGAVAPRTAPGEVVPMGESVSQTLAGLTPMNGQNISVNVSSASPHLPFGEWVKRGVLTALGNGLLFPFRLIGKVLEGIFMGVVGIVKMAIIVVLIPTLIWLGLMLQQHLSHASSVREGAAAATVQGGEVLKGITDGAKADRDPLAGKDDKKGERHRD